MHHYTYQIIDLNPTDGQEFYFGSRSAKNEIESDSYMGSPTSKNTKEFQRRLKHNRDEFIKIILGVFDTREEALKHEVTIHNLLDVKSNPHCYNDANQLVTGYIKNTTKTENHPSWKGFRNTPFGKFVSAKEMSDKLNITISDSYLNKLCSGNMGIITERQYNHSEVFRLIGRSVVGKTPTDLGFSRDWLTEERPKVFTHKYITPWGSFSTREEAVSGTQFNTGFIQRMCRRDVDKHISPKIFRSSKLYKLLGNPIDIIGRTPRMLGFNSTKNKSHVDDIVYYNMFCFRNECFFDLNSLNERFGICENGSSYAHKIFNKLNEQITKRAYSSSKFLQSISKNVVGKTYAELTFRKTTSKEFIPF